MGLFSKNKPTKRVDFEGGWVELQHLSKGVKDEIEKQTVACVKDVDLNSLEQLRNEQKATNLPNNIDQLMDINKIEYYKLSKAIKSWSEEESVSIESVQDLDEGIFDLISKEIDLMNKLSKGEEKN